MSWIRRHPADHDLLLLLDDEPLRRRVTRVRRHLVDCPTCQTRIARLNDELEGLQRAWPTAPDTTLPPAFAARARLGMRLAELSPGAMSSGVGYRWFYAAGVVAVAVCGLIVQARAGRVPAARDVRPAIFVLPQAALTPGAVRQVSLSELCGAARRRRMPEISAAIHQGVFRSYGADYRLAGNYELDYLITPELGGALDPRNLWPQPYSHTLWNAFVKDELELRFHEKVCAGEMDLSAAQQEIATDWVAAYKRHFKTDVPLRDYVAEPLTHEDADFLLAELEERGVSLQPSHASPRTVSADDDSLAPRVTRVALVRDRPLAPLVRLVMRHVRG